MSRSALGPRPAGGDREQSREQSGSSAPAVAPEGRAERIWQVLIGLARTPPPPPPRDAPVTSPRAAAPPHATRAARFLRSEQLVMEFDEAYTAFVGGFEVLPSEAQLLALQAVDQKLSAMVRAQEPELWTERAHREDPRWCEVRSLAEQVCIRFDWPTDSLVPSRASGADAEVDS